MIGEDVKEILECDLKLERAGHVDLKAAIAHCEKVGDYVSRELFEDILEAEEEHIDFIETQLDLIERIGLQNYCQSQMKAPS
jgi:bacterioferritin